MKTISVSEGRKQFSSMINWADENQSDVVIQSRGEAKVVIIPYVDYELLRKARERQRKEEAIKKLKRIAAEVQARNPDITPEEADKIGADVTREAIEGLVQKGRLSFE